MKASVGGSGPAQVRSSRAKAQKYPDLVRPRPASSTGKGVSSMKSLVDCRRLAGAHKPPAQTSRQCGTLDLDAPARMDLAMAKARRVIGVFRYDNRRQCDLGRKVRLDQVHRCGCLHNAGLAGPASIARAPWDHNTVLRGKDVRPFADDVALGAAGKATSISLAICARRRVESVLCTSTRSFRRGSKSGMWCDLPC